MLLLLIGFSIIAGPVLLLAYLRSSLFLKTAASIAACCAFVLILTVLQGFHFVYFTQGYAALSNPFYLFGLFVAPGLFLLFGRAVVLPKEPFKPALLTSFLPLLLPIFLPIHVALPALLVFGAVYACWLGWIAVSVHKTRTQYRFEVFFSVCIITFAVLTLAAVLLTPLNNPIYFYSIYSQSIGLAYVLVMYALVAIPGMVEDLFEIARDKYASSTLGSVDVNDQLVALQRLMEEDAIYTNDELKLATVAEMLGLSGHQLSELINRHLGLSYSQYLRQIRVQAAQNILRREPDQSVLSIALEVGYRSQSTFYAAFKQETGLSPGEYRDLGLREDQSG